MSAAISCLAPMQGLATSLDTLCAQAYGSGHKHLVGLQCQRMACFLMCLSFPVALLWFFAEDVLCHVIPEPESARLAGLYLRYMIFSIPGFVLFECGKRFTQAQGLFHATTWVLVFMAPFNVFLSWFFVWHLGYGFVGAPMAIAVTETLLPILLFVFVRFVDGSQCWGGFSRRALSNWGVMVRLALPGMVMVEAEWLAFEILTLLASRFGTEYLAAQSVLATITTITFQIPFPVSIAASTRIANLIGAGLVDAAKVTSVVVCARSLSHFSTQGLTYADLRGRHHHRPPQLCLLRHLPLQYPAALHRRPGRHRARGRGDSRGSPDANHRRHGGRRGWYSPRHRKAVHGWASQSIRLLRRVAAVLHCPGVWSQLEALGPVVWMYYWSCRVSCSPKQPSETRQLT